MDSLTPFFNWDPRVFNRMSTGPFKITVQVKGWKIDTDEIELKPCEAANITQKSSTTALTQ